VICNSSKTEGKGGDQQGGTTDKNMSKCMAKHNFLTSCQKFKKIMQEESFFYPVNNNFVQNASKFARSTLTSPSTIRVKSVLNQ
jgi:hypothetical protein